MPHLQTQSDLAKASSHVIAAMSNSGGLHFCIYAYQSITKFPRLLQECLFWCDASAWIPWEPRSMLRCGKGVFLFPTVWISPSKAKMTKSLFPRSQNQISGGLQYPEVFFLQPCWWEQEVGWDLHNACWMQCGEPKLISWPIQAHAWVLARLVTLQLLLHKHSPYWSGLVAQK